MSLKSVLVAIFLSSVVSVASADTWFGGTWKSDWGYSGIDTTLEITDVKENGQARVKYSWSQIGENPPGSIRRRVTIKDGKFAWKDGKYLFRFQKQGNNILGIREVGKRIDYGTFKKLN